MLRSDRRDIRICYISPENVSGGAMLSLLAFNRFTSGFKKDGANRRVC